MSKLTNGVRLNQEKGSLINRINTLSNDEDENETYAQFGNFGWSNLHQSLGLKLGNLLEIPVLGKTVV